MLSSHHRRTARCDKLLTGCLLGLLLAAAALLLPGVAAASAAPAISGLSSPSHPHQSTWYQNRIASFSWTPQSGDSGIVGYQYSLDAQSSFDPASAMSMGSTSFLPLSSIPLAMRPNDIVVADFDHDGNQDIATVNGTGGANGSVSVLLGAGDGTFTASADYTVGKGARRIVAANLNPGTGSGHDGFLDLVTADSGGTLSVLMGNGDGTFQSAVSYAAGGNPWSVAVGDLNGDGRPDLVSVTPNPDNSNPGPGGRSGITVLLGNGDGTFPTFDSHNPHMYFFAPQALDAVDVTVHDVTGDGAQDLIVPLSWSPSNTSVVAVYPGIGDGTFGTCVQYPSGGEGQYACIRQGDFNGDGVTDFAIANSYDPAKSTVSVLLGQADGTLGGWSNFPVAPLPQGLAVGDINGDGVADLVTCAYNGTSGSVLVGHGDGTFGPTESFTDAGDGQGVAIGDLDNDGKTDVATVNYSLSQISLHLNVSGTKIVTAPNDGVWYFHIRAQDGHGVWGDAATYAVNIDADAPASQVLTFNGTPGQNGWYNSGGAATIGCSDAGSGIAQMFYGIDDPSASTLALPLTSLGPAVSFVLPPITDNGTYTVYWRAVDVAGNSSVTWSQEIKIDWIVPQIHFAGASDSHPLNSSLSLVPLMTDHGSGVPPDYLNNITMIVRKPDASLVSIDNSTWAVPTDILGIYEIYPDSHGEVTDISGLPPDPMVSYFYEVGYQLEPSVEGGGGSVSPSDPVVVDVGGSQTFTLTPDAHYHIDQVLLDGTTPLSITDNHNGTFSCTVSNVTADHAIGVTFAIDVNVVTAGAGSGGTISPNGAMTVAYGGDQTFIIYPDAHHHIDQVLLDGTTPIGVTDIGGGRFSATLTNVTAGHSLIASFAIDTFTITAGAGGGGSIDPSGSVVVAYGDNQTFDITPDADHHIVDVVADGNHQGPITSYDFGDVHENHTISATFAADDANPPSGSFLVNGGAQYTNDRHLIIASSVTDDVTPQPQLQMRFSLDGGTSWSTPWTSYAATATLAVPAADDSYTVTAQYRDLADNQLTLTAASPIGLDTTPPTFGLETILFPPPVGFVALNPVQWINENSALFQTHDDDTGLIDSGIAGYSWAFDAPAPHAIMWSGWGGPTITGLPEGQHQVYLAVRDNAGNWSIGGYPESTSVRIDTVKPVITITAPANGATYTQGAMVNADFGVTDASSGVASATGTVANGQPFGTSTLGDNTFTVNATDNAGNPATVTYHYAVNAPSHTLTYTAGANGTIVGTTPQTVPNGGSGTAVTATPSPGYHFVSWSDGSTANPRTDTNVTADHAVTASFAINTYTLTVTQAANGTITPTGPLTVNYGDSKTFTFTPAGGYRVSDIRVDGVSVFSLATPIGNRVWTYTLATITANHAITASFIANTDATPPTITTDPGFADGNSYLKGQPKSIDFAVSDGGSGTSLALWSVKLVLPDNSTKNLKLTAVGSTGATTNSPSWATDLTSQRGAYTATITAFDKAGNQSSQVVHYVVAGDVGGGLQEQGGGVWLPTPPDSPPTVNIDAHPTIPLMFSIKGDVKVAGGSPYLKSLNPILFVVDTVTGKLVYQASKPFTWQASSNSWTYSWDTTKICVPRAGRVYELIVVLNDPQGRPQFTTTCGSDSTSTELSPVTGTTSSTQAALEAAASGGDFQALAAAQAAPTITSFTPTSGGIGTSVKVTGTTLTGATAVTFNGAAATTFTVNSATQITVTVPAGATTGKIAVTTPGGTATSSSSFTVLPPTITSFTPLSVGLGSAVTLTGTNFTGVTAVKFNGTLAYAFAVQSATKITATVASGTTGGKITVTSSAGTATSASSFTIAAPAITSSTPTPTVDAGTTETLSGTGFGTKAGTVTLSYIWNDTSQAGTWSPLSYVVWGGARLQFTASTAFYGSANCTVKADSLTSPALVLNVSAGQITGNIRLAHTG